ncbi:glycosyl hydrolase family 8 [Nocardioides bruguierae]|uniref:glycosyl hydrolase family 8 n=1 Tax=Nocardioides bruguierae TaxID=2945102 RepID=UPI00202295E6|nr:glycosyl hydrolase family 8 [Nocardioides bruguierae]MCL8025417.1 glycosyl hydrolase family 8 [Nocardioides bruguierae]
MSRLNAPAWTILVVGLVLVVGVAGFVLTAGDDDAGPAPASSTATDAPTAAEVFLDDYVDDDGRVVRHDQGGDTVSEGQAYAMLVAVGTDDRDTFDAVWSWTQEHLVRADDGLLAWRWADGAVADPSSASDADLDAARALVLAGRLWGDDGYTQAGVSLGQAILDHETVSTPAGLVLVAGQWATSSAPYWFNPSYVSPAATQVLASVDDDPRWTQLEEGSAQAVRAATVDGQLTPDWAQVDDSGNAWPTSAPDGSAPVFSYDAARTIVRNAESCRDADREIADALVGVLGTGEPYGTYSLDAQPQTGDLSSLMAVSMAAGAAVRGDTATADARLQQARDVQASSPSYYGAAWAALGPLMLTTDALGGCPPLGGDGS